jgi:hypothetical protein
MIDTQDLTLVVREQLPGSLITNALEIKAYVTERVKDYIPENYYDNLDAAKKDRAELNTAAKTLNAKRLELEKAFNRPFEEFKGIINDTVKAITFASSKLDEVVKAVEETEKAEKRIEIDSIWKTTGFDLFPIDRVFDQKWLNKGSKLKDIKAEIQRIIGKTFEDLKTIEAIGSDVDQVKALYIDTLDIGQALAKGQQLKANRERLEREAAARPEREHTEHIEAARVELAKEAATLVVQDQVASLAADADEEEEKDPIIEYTLTFRGTRSQLVAMKAYMLDLGIEYSKV